MIDGTGSCRRVQYEISRSVPVSAGNRVEAIGARQYAQRLESNPNQRSVFVRGEPYERI
jgi:hypothetical protein